MKFLVASGFFLALFVLSGLPSSSVHAQAGFQQQTPHVHGTALLTLVQDGSTLLIEFESPAINIVGFEHAPQNPSQRQAIEEAIQILESIDSVLLLSALDCEMENTSAATTGEFSAHTHDGHSQHDHSHGHAHEHAGFRVVYELNCRSGTLPPSIAINAFANFRGLEVIDAQWALNRSQGARRVPSSLDQLRLDP
jgi:hypothetical protein